MENRIVTAQCWERKRSNEKTRQQVLADEVPKEEESELMPVSSQVQEWAQQRLNQEKEHEKQSCYSCFENHSSMLSLYYFLSKTASTGTVIVSK